jgi:hypothetical protein
MRQSIGTSTGIVIFWALFLTHACHREQSTDQSETSEIAWYFLPSPRLAAGTVMPPTVAVSTLTVQECAGGWARGSFQGQSRGFSGNRSPSAARPHRRASCGQFRRAAASGHLLTSPRIPHTARLGYRFEVRVPLCLPPCQARGRLWRKPDRRHRPEVATGRLMKGLERLTT